ncbi:hypothetical protein AB0E66_27180 [Streptomyces sp. NPDC033753]|uniref:Tc toxin subunit A-related protein n=1 Tax=Streptomyces sp. NPDC033753 TaxID=3155128 RepID=UPI00340E3863
MDRATSLLGFHHEALRRALAAGLGSTVLVTRPVVTYTFDNHYHPYAGELLALLNRSSMDGLFDPARHEAMQREFFDSLFDPVTGDLTVGAVRSRPEEIDLGELGPYAVYNWELLFHIPFTIAVHLSKNQRFAEAQRWFHRIFDPTGNDTSLPEPQRYWKFLRFRQSGVAPQIDELLALMAKPADECTPEELRTRELVLYGYEAVRARPFRPHAVARTRVTSYQYAVVTKYLDNLVAWGDSLFRQDTIETLNEATQLYVLAGNLLGPRPQEVPRAGEVAPKTFAELRRSGLDPLGNALVDLEARFPFNLYRPTVEGVNTDTSAPLLGLGRTLYFCVPPNDKLLGYWDLVDDRLFKIRRCMNLEGVVRQLPLFEPKLDPGLLVKAAAAGIDLSSVVGGLQQPQSPVRAPLLISKAQEVCAAVRELGSALLSALEKQDNEQLALLRQQHEIGAQKRIQDVRFLQWKDAEEATENLLRARETVFDRHRHYQLLLGKKDADIAHVRSLALDRSPLTEDNFDEVYAKLVTQYATPIAPERDEPGAHARASDPKAQAGLTSLSDLRLIPGEDRELNEHMPAAQARQREAVDIDTLYSVLGMLPNFGIDIEPFGLGGHMELGGPSLAAIGRILSGRERGEGERASAEGARAGRAAGYERRMEDWTQQSNAAAYELMANGRQLISSLIREQIARREYDNHQKDLDASLALERSMREKFTGAELYGWMQGELSKQFYACYRMAFDVARQAEQTAKRELMRPELDQTDFIKFNYWDGGRRGLLAGEALQLDLKRLELAYHEHNRHEYELTKNVSLAQLDPLALMRLRETGTCEFGLPEWLYDLDCPGHYLRRIKSVGLTLAAVTGPYTGVHATLTQLRSSVRLVPLAKEGEGGPYARKEADDRFADYTGSAPSIVTSTGSADSGMFETNLREDRFLPMEGTGAVGQWRVVLPKSFPAFDYDTIADLVLHVRYTARPGGEKLHDEARDFVAAQLQAADRAGLTRLFSLRHDFPSAWHAFTTGQEAFSAPLTAEHFPFFAQSGPIRITGGELHRPGPGDTQPVRLADDLVESLSSALKTTRTAALTLPPDEAVLTRDTTTDVLLLLRYALGT